MDELIEAQMEEIELLQEINKRLMAIIKAQERRIIRPIVAWSCFLF